MTDQANKSNIQQDSAIPAGKRSDDKDPRRATFGVLYPQEILSIANGSDVNKITSSPGTEAKRSIASKKITITARAKTICDAAFDGCNFHDKGGTDMASIALFTFRECAFNRCMMGTTKYYRIIFDRCTFAKCDFVNADFLDCIFRNCTFSQCTAERFFMTNTRISASSLLAGLQAPEYNYSSSAPEQIAGLRREWKKIRYEIACTILKSVSETQDSVLSDEALRETKSAECAYLHDMWIHGIDNYSSIQKDLSGALTVRFTQGIGYALKKANIWLTKGGTSLFNLTMVLLLLALLVPIPLSLLSINYGAERCSIPMQNFTEAACAYFRWIPASISLLLTFGFGSFKSDTGTGDLFLVFASSFGLVWYSLLIPVIIRRVYK